MPDLVTLNAAPYNPYNDSFARFAMQGLSMGLEMMQHKDNLAQRQSEQMQSMISESTQNLYRGAEMQMRNKELNHRIENDQFNRQLDAERLKFSKDSFWTNVAMQKDERTYQREQDKNVNNPATLARTAALVQETDYNKRTFDDRIMALKLGNIASSIGIAQNTQALAASGLANDYNRATFGARVAGANLEPAKAASELQKSMIDVAPYVEDPTLRKREKESTIRLQDAQATQAEGRAEYYKNGGAEASRALTRSVEVRDMVGSQKTLSDQLKTLNEKAATANQYAASSKKAIDSKKFEGAELEKQKRMLKKYEDEAKSHKADISGIEAQLRMAQAGVTEVLKLYNEVLRKRGLSTFDIGKMSDDEKRAKFYEASEALQKEGAAFPGSQENLSPAEQAARETQAGRPIGTPSKAAPTSRYDATDFGDLD